MSRLEKLILRFLAQKSHLDRAIGLSQELEGMVIEVGLGSGRSFDHLRKYMKNRELYAFDYKVECHPGCTPHPDQQVLGAIEETLPQFSYQHSQKVALLHIDVGTKKYEEDLLRYKKYLPHLKSLLKSGALLVSDRPFEDSELLPLPKTPENKNWPYFSYVKN